MKKNLVFAICNILLILSILNCNGKDEEMKDTSFKAPNISNISESTLSTLKTKKIFFAHQSVGRNIISGIEAIESENKNFELPIIETTNMTDDFQGGIIHKNVGTNTKPLTKLKEFETLINDQLNEKIDIAILKFCYIDFNENTDINSLFNTYTKSITELKTKYPQISFIHCTVPLESRASGLKGLIKKVLGKTEGDINNMIRNKYNKMLKDYYENKDQIFDIAKFESTYSDGTINSFKYKDQTYRHMIADYTYDGGHLNDKGSKILATGLLEILSK